MVRACYFASVHSRLQYGIELWAAAADWERVFRLQKRAMATNVRDEVSSNPIIEPPRRYKTSNNITREETGMLINGGQPGTHIRVQGSVSYYDPNGELITLRYFADDKGYRILPKEEQDVLLVNKNQEVSPLIVASLLGSG
ncbi:uncharacterized protein LOC125226528 [Leguminivora glycinivorella]|uniref:uncharacterized protein LOC125226528 n=1 Tax=Leguminivora glycinivorella TaxID=1035111 RepID=UPI00200C8BF9|nr:uncharacterized protein LOC125226528 [Leguminivora glycinivorella]